MLTTAIEETSDFGQICLTPQIEDWRRKLEHTCRHLMPWACSAQMLPMWVSDYGKVCRLANSLNMKIDELFKLTSQDFPTDAIANASVVAAIDHTIDEIGQIGRRIETELHDSIGGSDQPTRTNTNWPSFHRQSW